MLEERGARIEAKIRHIAPLGRVADLRAEGRELFQGLRLRALAHPRALSNRLAIGFKKALHQGIHTIFRSGREVPTHPDAAEGFSGVGFDQAQRALPSGAQLLRARQDAAEEIEVLLDEG